MRRLSGGALLALSLALAAPAGGEWLKAYQVSTIAENWTLDIELDDFDKGVPEVLEAFSRNGAEMTRPLAELPGSEKNKVQQVVYRVRKKSMKAVLRNIRRIGRVGQPRVIPSPRVPLDEIREKSKKLRDDKNANAEAFARMPAVAALVSELLSHLAQVEQSARASRSILVNLTVRESP